MNNIWIIIFGIAAFFLIVIKILIAELEIAAKLSIIAIIFLIITGGYVYLGANSDIKNPDGAMDFAKVYFVWLSNKFSDTMDISGYIGKQDWKIENNSKTN